MPIDDLLYVRSGFKESWSVKGFLAVILVLFIIPGANAACSISGGCGGNTGDWESSANAFLNSDVPGSFIPGDAVKANDGSEVPNGNEISSDNATGEKALNNTTSISIEHENVNYVSPSNRSDDYPNGGFLKPLTGVYGPDVVIDATNGNGYSNGPHIKGAIHLPSKSFLYENGTLRRASELVGILGDAGIDRADRAIIYGDSLASGDATFVFWVMRYLGMDNAMVLDGGLNDWISAGLPLESGPNVKTPTIYESRIRQGLLAYYDYVKGGKAQIVDAETVRESGNRIPGSISIDSEQVLENGHIKDVASLNETLSGLRKDKPVVVCSKDTLNASLVWYALQLMGYDSTIYTWKDWEAHQSTDAFEGNAKTVGIGSVVTDSSKYKKLG